MAADECHEQSLPSTGRSQWSIDSFGRDEVLCGWCYLLTVSYLGLLFFLVDQPAGTAICLSFPFCISFLAEKEETLLPLDH